MKRSTFLRIFCIGAGALAAFSASAQKLGDGRITGSFETNSIYYVPDDDIGAEAPNDRIGSHNYLKLEYTNGRLTVGGQFEYYGKALQGYNRELDGGKVTNKYVTWADRNYSITVGDIYEQFGNGLILRSWEDRFLAFNNSIEGVRATYRFNDYLSAKALWGRPRYAMDYLDTEIRGIDLSLSLSSIFNMPKHYLAVEGSFVNRYMERGDMYEAIGMSNNMDSWSGRLVLETDFGFYFRGEVVGKGEDPWINSMYDYEAKRGNAQYVELGYNGRGFGILLTGRRMERMGMKISDDSDIESSAPDNNVMNYLPSITRQLTYMLTNLNPYKVYDRGEQGAALDVIYNIPKSTTLGGRYGTKLHVNGSMLFPTEKAADGDRNLMYADASLDITRKWNKSFETTLLYMFQAYNPDHGVNNSFLAKSNVFVLDMLYKFNRRTSLRVELQYLQSDDSYDDWNNDWWGVLAEVNLAPKWSFFASDMYNWDMKKQEGGLGKEHYYNVGFSFSEGRTRLALSYGRNRKGYICSGGVCRMMPAYTGANLTFTTSF